MIHNLETYEDIEIAQSFAGSWAKVLTNMTKPLARNTNS